MNIQFNEPVHALSFHAPLQKTHVLAKQNEQSKDTLSIGQQARHLFKQQATNHSLIENLMKQREQVLEMKNGATERALEQGTNPSSLKEQLKQFEEQLAAIDAQIAQAQKAEQPAQQEQKKEEKPKTVEEAIFSQADSLGQTKKLQRMDRSLTREKATVASEMNLDARRGVYSESKASRVAEIDEQMTFVQRSLAEQISPMKATEVEEMESSKVVTVQEYMQEKAEEEQGSNA